MKELSFIIEKPSVKPIGVIQILHGMQEYKERYLHFIRYLNSLGYVVVIHDHQGHGKGADELGYLGEDGWNKLIEDTDRIQKMIKEEYPDIPYILFGHSMGSMVARSYFKRKQDGVDILMLSGAPSYNKLGGLAVFISSLLMKVKGQKYHSKLLDKMYFMEANQKYPDLTWLSLDKENIVNYKKDPYCGIPFSVSAFHYLAKGMIDMHDYQGVRANDENKPILFVVGQDDPIVRGAKGLADSINVFKQAGFKKVDSLVYPKMRHEIFNESIKDEVYKDVGEWLAKQLNTDAERKYRK